MAQNDEVIEFFRRRSLIEWLYAAGVLLLLLSGWLWWSKVSVDPEHVFWGMISNNLSASGVTLQVEQASNGSSNQQLVQLGFGPEKATHTLTTIKQGTAAVKTENIGTPKADYTRYISIKTQRKGQNGRAIDLSRIKGVWANTSSGQPSADQNVPQLFSQVLLSMSVPLGNLPPAQRSELLQEMRDDTIYKTSFTKIKKQRSHGRLQYVYNVTVQPLLYVRLMKAYAHDLGLHELDSVYPLASASSLVLK